MGKQQEALHCVKNMLLQQTLTCTILLELCAKINAYFVEEVFCICKTKVATWTQHEVCALLDAYKQGHALV